MLIGLSITAAAAMDRPPWRYSAADGQLHLIRHEIDDVAETLCDHHMSVAELAEPGDEDQTRCPLCVRVFGAQRAGDAA